MESIPVVDLADFLSDDLNKKSNFVNALGKAYETVGFVAVKNHTIPEELIKRLYQGVQRFFSLPLEKKVEYDKYQNNYTYKNQQIALQIVFVCIYYLQVFGGF